MAIVAKRSETVLDGIFSLFPTKNPLYKVCLTRQSLSFIEHNVKETNDTVKHILIGDIIGCKCRKSKTHKDSAAYFTLFAYPFRTKTFSGKRTRYRVDLTFAVRTCQNFEDNLKIAQRWRHVILCLARGGQVDKEEIENCVAPVGKKILILINPHSGPGRAQQIFEKEVGPMLQEADVPYKMVITEYAGHATDIMKNLNLSEWYSVVIVSGDGLIFEVINGLMGRDDWSEAIKFPVGCIPGGSGNALCWTINYTAGEPLGTNMTLHSTFVLIKHKVIPMDLVVLETPTMQYFSFLMLSWGIVADIDYESEKMRALGSTRFTIYALLRILKLRTYRGRISFLPLTDYQPKLRDKIKENGVTTSNPRHYSVINHSQSVHKFVHDSVTEHGVHGTYKPMTDRLRSVSMPSHISESGATNGRFNGLKQTDGTLSDLEDNRKEIEDMYLENVIEEDQENGLGIDDKSHVYKFDEQGKSTTNDHLSKSEINLESGSKNNNTRKSVPCPLLPPLDKSVPETWVTLEEDFVTIMALYQPYIGPDNLAAPDARLNDGFIHMLIVRAGTPKNALLNMFTAMEKGEHIDNPYVDVVKVKAFRLEPLSQSGNIMIDGERIDPCMVQGQMLPGISRIMAIQ